MFITDASNDHFFTNIHRKGHACLQVLGHIQFPKFIFAFTVNPDSEFSKKSILLANLNLQIKN